MAYFADDEDVAIKDGADYLRLVPPDQKAATFSDGILNGFSLTSAAADFEAIGVLPGMAVEILKGSVVASPDLLVVESVSGHSLTLRRKGREAGLGAVPNPTPVSGVIGTVKTLLPQLAAADRALRYRYLPDGSDPDDPAVFTDVAVLSTLVGLYGSQQTAGSSRTSGEVSDNYRIKYRQYQAELAVAEELLASLYGGTTETPDANEFGNRVGSVGDMAIDPCWRIPRNY